MLEPVPLSATTRNLFLILLSVAAGCVDAIAFVNTGIFPANMTGNSVVLAITLVNPGFGNLLLSLLALAGYSLGAAVGSKSVHAPEHGWSRQISAILLAAALLVLGSAAAMPFTDARFLPVIIVAASAAMGLQSAAVQQIGVAGVSTVFVTGTLTMAISRLVNRPHRPAARALQSEKEFWLPAMSWASYFLGAAIGGLQHALHTGLPVIVPGAILLGVALLSARAQPAK